MKKNLMFVVVFFVFIFSIYANPGDLKSTEKETVALWDELGVKYKKSTKGSITSYSFTIPGTSISTLHKFEYGLLAYIEMQYKDKQDIIDEYQKLVKRYGSPNQRSGNIQIWFVFSVVRMINIENQWDAYITSDYFEKYIRPNLPK